MGYEGWERKTEEKDGGEKEEREMEKVERG